MTDASKHTSGPWAINGPARAPYIVGAGGRVYVAGIESKTCPDRHKLLSPRDAADANARLIAAAPDLLAALKALIPCVDRDDELFVDELTQARAAVAKAR